MALSTSRLAAIRFTLVVFLFIGFCYGCGGDSAATAEPPTPTIVVIPPTELVPTATPHLYPTNTPAPTPTVTPTVPPPTPTPTLRPLSNDAQGGQIITQNLLSNSGGVETYNLVYSSDNLRITGYLLKPAGQGPFPAVVYNHGGVGTSADPAEFAPFAEQGYVVVATNYRGNGGSEGKEDLGDKDNNDVINAIKLARGLAYVDPKRIVMVGGSRGGLETLLALERLPDPTWIRAAVVYFPPTDMNKLFDHFNKIPQDKWPQVIKDTHDIIKCSPDQCTDVYRVRSPVLYAALIQAPVLLLHGDADTTVPLEQSVLMANALQKAGKVYELHVYPGYGHGFIPGDWTDPRARTKAWIEKYNK